MAANTAPIYVKNITAKLTQWTNSDAANTKKTICPTIGTEGTRIHSIVVTTDDTTGRDIALYLNDGSNDMPLGVLSIASGSGTTVGGPSVTLNSFATTFTFVGTDGSILIPSGWLLKGAIVTQPTSAKTWSVLVLGGDY